MNIIIAANTKPSSEVAVFFKPFLEIESIERLDVFGDGVLFEHDRIHYHKPKLNRIVFLKLLYRLGQMLSRRWSCTNLFIGIYEIPHGILACLAAKAHRKPAVLCIIGNPQNKKLRHGWRKKAMNWSIRNSAVVTVTGSQSRAGLLSEGIPADKVFILPNAIDLPHLSWPPTEKKYDLVSIGRLSPEKKLDLFIKVVQIVKEKIPTVRAAIAGRGPAREYLEKLILEAGLEDTIHLPGYVDDKNAFLQSGRIFLLTSSTEGLPRAVIEGFACGLPCIASCVGDVSDLVKDGETGYLIPDHDNAHDFAARALYLLKNQEVLDNLSGNAVAHARLHYSFSSASATWRAIIQKCQG